MSGHSKWHNIQAKKARQMRHAAVFLQNSEEKLP